MSLACQIHLSVDGPIQSLVMLFIFCHFFAIHLALPNACHAMHMSMIYIKNDIGSSSLVLQLWITFVLCAFYCKL